MVIEMSPLYLTLQAPGLPPVPAISGGLFLALLGVDSTEDALLKNLTVVVGMYGAAALLAIAALYARVAALKHGYM